MKYIKQLAIICTISFLAEILEYVIPFPVAASVYGLILILIALITKILPLEKVEDTATFLVEIMPIMFILPTVRIMAQWDVVQSILVPIFVICLVSTVTVFFVTGHVAQAILRKGKKNGGSDE